MQISEHQQLILGPPGCGKTHTLMNSVQESISKGVSSEDVAFVSFTRKAVNEARDRAIEKFNLKSKSFPLFQTVHSLCFRNMGITKKQMVDKDHLKEIGDWLGYTFEATLDETQLNVSEELGDTLLFLENYSRITGTPLRQVWEENPYGCHWDELERFQQAYTDYKSHHQVFDFTDLLYAYIDYCEPSAAKVAFVDEAQDLSYAQWEVLQHAFKNTPKVVIAGDDDQSIYKWSGADTDRFLSLTGNQTILNQSYRLPKAVHKFAQGIISKIDKRFHKPFQATDKEGSVNFVQSAEQAEISSHESTLILVRNTYLLSKAQQFLERQGIPYIGRSGYSSVRRGHLEAIRACESIRAQRNVTGKMLKELFEVLRVGDYLERGHKAKVSLLSDNETVTAEETRSLGLKPLNVWHESLEGIPYNQRQYYRAIMANGYKLSEDPKLRISTIHGIKGGEADHVIVYSDMAKKSFEEYCKNPDNERRVAYVAVTRSKDKLSIVNPYTRRFFDYRSESYVE